MSSTDYIDDDVLEQFPERLQPCLRDLFTNQEEIVGVSIGNMYLKSSTTSHVGKEDEPTDVSLFVLSIPYATESLEWTIIFNDEHLELAPDFQFDDETFMTDPDFESIEKNIPSWEQWDINNSKSLLNIVKEIYLFYKQHQVNVMGQDSESRATFEYTCLTGGSEMEPNKIEVLNRGDTVLFLIYLDVPFPELPIYNDESKDPQKDAALLFVKFTTVNSIDSKLYLTPRIENLLSEYSCLRKPPFTSETCLMDYVPTVTKWLSNKLEYVSGCYKKCQEYITSMLVLYGRHVIEYDPINFSKVVLLFETEGFFWLLSIILGKNFPIEKPKYKYQSTECLVFGEPYSELCSDYPYHSSWKPTKMIKKALININENIPTFKENAIARCTS